MARKYAQAVGISPLLEVPRADEADGRDVFFFVLGTRGLGKFGQAPDRNQRQPDLVACLEQQGVEQRAVLAGAVEVLNQLVDRRPPARWRRGFPRVRQKGARCQAPRRSQSPTLRFDRSWKLLFLGRSVGLWQMALSLKRIVDCEPPLSQSSR